MKTENEMMEENSSFKSGVQIAWDSVSLGLLKQNPRKYQLKIRQGWEHSHRPPALTFGILLHSALEDYYKFRAEGKAHQESLEIILQTYIQTSFSRGDEILELESSKDPKRTRETLIRTIIWYTDQFQNDHAETLIFPDGTPAVELSFRLPLPIDHPSGESYILCGHIDRIVTFNDQTYVMDHKTSGGALNERFFNNFSPDNQMSLYALAARVVFSQPARGVIVDGIQLGATFSRFQRGFANRTPSQLDEWLINACWWIKLAERMAEESYFPLNDKTCSMYGGDEFREVYAADPAVRPNILEADFVQQKWDPIIPR